MCFELTYYCTNMVLFFPRIKPRGEGSLPPSLPPPSLPPRPPGHNFVPLRGAGGGSKVPSPPRSPASRPTATDASIRGKRNEKTPDTRPSRPRPPHPSAPPPRPSNPPPRAPPPVAPSNAVPSSSRPPGPAHSPKTGTGLVAYYSFLLF